MSDLTQLAVWSKLSALADTQLQMRELFATDKQRATQYFLRAAGLRLDYSKNLINERILHALFELARARACEQHKEALFSGKIVNISEQRPALHTALRAEHSANTATHGARVSMDIEQARQNMYDFGEKIRSDTYRACEDVPIKHIVHIGIGGSDLGVHMACEALRVYTHSRLDLRFVANVDPACLAVALKDLDARATLCIVQSKSFSTHETLLNARAAMDWYSTAGVDSERHVFAVTANPARAIDYGIAADNIFEFSDCVGGRYSIWGSAGLVLAIAIGQKHFSEFLQGGAAMDQHFKTAPQESNMPLILALLSIWYQNFLQARSYACLPYSEDMGLFPCYLQQLEMESNGKSVDAQGMPLDYESAQVVWGARGTNAQHSFFQFLHQGTRMVPVDFIAACTQRDDAHDRQRVLLANMIAQAAALMNGRDGDDVPAHQRSVGNRPSNVILLDELNPFCLGALIALYEHKVFVQGAIWGINSYDQWGVEHGKILARALLDQSSNKRASLDASSLQLLNILKL